MIIITQGHEEGIGIETFLKSYLCLPKHIQKIITFVGDRVSIKSCLKQLGINYKVTNNQFIFSGSVLNFVEAITDNSLTQSTTSLNSGIELAMKNPQGNILLTLPTSKDQLLINGKAIPGHTEFFRKIFNKNEIGMCFHGPSTNLLLLTDHVPLREVTSQITKSLIIKKVFGAINELKLYDINISKVIFSGINPHCGENGLMGTEDNVIVESINDLKEKFSEIEFLGPKSGDTLGNLKRNEKTLLVFSHHDQGLSFFKNEIKVNGINITTGAPIKRISVDHGTAFNLRGKNKANYLSCLNTILFAFKKIENINESKRNNC